MPESNNEMRPQPKRGGLRPAILIGPAVLILLSATYFLMPEFYLRWILNAVDREYQAVEITTFIAAVIAGVLLAFAAWRLLRHGPDPRRERAWPVAVIAIVAAATLFFAGEEISWGQTYLGWSTPESYQNVSIETNLHNTDLPVQSAGSVFLIAVFFVFPAVWAVRRSCRLPIPEGLGLAVPGAAAIVCTAAAFIWKELKTISGLLQPDFKSTRLYLEFVEQFNEHKEMLIAIALLIHAVDCTRRVSRAVARNDLP